MYRNRFLNEKPADVHIVDLRLADNSFQIDSLPFYMKVDLQGSDELLTPLPVGVYLLRPGNGACIISIKLAENQITHGTLGAVNVSSLYNLDKTISELEKEVFGITLTPISAVLRPSRSFNY